jgi:hypothetical protein
MLRCRASLSPLDVMIDNMKYWRGRSKEFEAQVKQLIESGNDEQTLEQIRQLLFAAREQAQLCAGDAAPYCHPKVRAMSIKGEVRQMFAEITDDMTLEEMQRAYAENLRRLG